MLGYRRIGRECRESPGGEVIRVKVEQARLGERCIRRIGLTRCPFDILGNVRVFRALNPQITFALGIGLADARLLVIPVDACFFIQDYAVTGNIDPGLVKSEVRFGILVMPDAFLFRLFGKISG